jgi:hypothetical protein
MSGTRGVNVREETGILGLVGKPEKWILLGRFRCK